MWGRSETHTRALKVRLSTLILTVTPPLTLPVRGSGEAVVLPPGASRVALRSPPPHPPTPPWMVTPGFENFALNLAFWVRRRPVGKGVYRGKLGESGAPG